MVIGARPWDHVAHMDNDIMMAEVSTSTTERMRPGAVEAEELVVVEDMEEMVSEEQNESMR